MSIPGVSGITRVPDSVFILDAALETIKANAFAEAPLECCGLLLGRFASPDPSAPPLAGRPLVIRPNASDAPAGRGGGEDAAIHSAYYVIDSGEPGDAEKAMEATVEAAVEAARARVREELGLPDENGEGGFIIPLPNVLTVADAIPTRNASPHPTRYLVEPEDHFRILREARRRGLDIVGAYHSHAITKPMPSETDLAEAHPHFLYVIASPDWDTGEGCDIRAWWLVDGNFQEVTIVPVP